MASPSSAYSRPLPLPPIGQLDGAASPVDAETSGRRPQRQHAAASKRTSSLQTAGLKTAHPEQSSAASPPPASAHPDPRQSMFAELSAQIHHKDGHAYSASAASSAPDGSGFPASGQAASPDPARTRRHHQHSELPQLTTDSGTGASPLSSYTRSALPGLAHSHRQAAPSTSSMTPSSLASNNGNAGANAHASAQTRSPANTIVSPVPQRRIDVGDPESALLPSPPSLTLNSSNSLQGYRQHSPNNGMHNGDDNEDALTLEEAQERTPSTVTRRMPSYREELPVIPPAVSQSSSFSLIDDLQAAHLRTSSSSHMRQGSDESSPRGHTPPKPKLRNLDTSMLAARSKVSSFFGGLSDSLASAGGHSQQQQQHRQHSQNIKNGNRSSSASYSSHHVNASPATATDRTQTIPTREPSPQPQSSSYPSTSHMQLPLSSVAQIRSQSQPTEHQQQIPQYAIAQQHSQQLSNSSAAAGWSDSLHPRSSFYGLDGSGQNDEAQQAQRWKGERRASPSTVGSSLRTASRSMPRSDTGHYTSASLGGTSLYGGYAGSSEAAAGPSRRRVTSWATRSNTSSVYGLSMTSPQLGPSASGDLPPVPAVPHLTQAHLRPGQGVSLLSHQKTLDMYRANVKKTNDPEVTFELAQFMLGLAREMAIQEISASAMNGAQIPPMAPGISDENLLSSLNGGLHQHNDGDSSPSPDPSFSFHSRSSGSSGELASAAAGLAVGSHGRSSQGLSQQQQQQPPPLPNTAGLHRRRGSHSPSPSISATAKLGMHRTGSPTSAGPSASVNDRKALVAEALSLLKRSADRGHVASQYFLADIYANGGMESQKSSSRASIYSLLPGGGNSSRATGQGPSGSGNVSPLDTMNPSPTGSAASLNAPNYFNGNGTSTSLSPNPSSSAHHASHYQKPDFERALPLFIAAAKHGHVPSAYRAGECFENGWGCRKDSTKAVQFYRKSAASSFPEAMYRLGMAELNGELGLKDRQKEGFKWLKQVAALAESNNSDNNGMNSAQDGHLSNNGFSSSSSGGIGLSDETEGGNDGINHQGIRLCTVQALHELALLHERGIDNVVFVDNEYAAELLARASELGYAPSAYKLGECYEYGRMGCPQDAALSIHYYNIAAQQNHREACFALTAWYLVGSPGVLPQSDTEAYLWAKKAAEQGLAKAEYAVGYFTEVGIGTIKDERDAIQWFRKAAEHGDKRAITRLRTLGVNTDNLPLSPTSPRSGKTSAGRRSHRASNAPHPGTLSPMTPDHRRSSGEVSNEKQGSKRRSRRNTLPGLMGMTNKEERPPLPAEGQQALKNKKADGDCVIS